MARTQKKRGMSLRSWITVFTLLLLVVVVFFARDEIIKAWELLGEVNPWILALLLPAQLLSYYAVGGIIFSYLQRKGNLKDIGRLYMARVSLELNFVNHILPSGGAAGFSYLSWLLRHHGVSVGRSTMAQIVRFVLTFVSFAMLLLVAIVVLTLNHTIERMAVISGGVISLAVVGVLIFTIWLLSSRSRLNHFSAWAENAMNKTVRFFTRGRRKTALKAHVLKEFFDDIHDDYVVIRKERRILVRPFLWATFANFMDAVLLWVTFWALGAPADIALLFIAYGVSSILGALSVTPAGAGVYEATMIAFLTTSGMPADIAIAGVLLSRVVLVLGTIAFGYFFYQLTIFKYGDGPDIRDGASHSPLHR